jgi:hypothetical protein
MNGQQSTPLMLCAENTSYAMALGVDVYFRSHWIHLDQWKWCITEVHHIVIVSRPVSANYKHA